MGEASTWKKTLSTFSSDKSSPITAAIMHGHQILVSTALRVDSQQSLFGKLSVLG